MGSSGKKSGRPEQRSESRFVSQFSEGRMNIVAIMIVRFESVLALIFKLVDFLFGGPLPSRQRPSGSQRPRTSRDETPRPWCFGSFGLRPDFISSDRRLRWTARTYARGVSGSYQY